MHEQNNDKNDLSVKLAAYVLGELDAAEAQELELALASSEELRAEKAQLEAVIGLVREHGAEDLALSGSARESLLSEAPGAKPLSFYERQMPQRMATAATVLILAGVATTFVVTGNLNESANGLSVELARRETGPSQSRNRAAESQDKEQAKTNTVSEEVMVTVDAQAEALPLKIEEPLLQESEPEKVGGGGGGPATPGLAGPGSPGPFDSKSSNNAIGIGGGAGGAYGSRSGGRKLGKKGVAAPAAGGERFWFAEQEESDRRVDSFEEFEITGETLAGLGATGSEDFFLGHGDKDGAATAQSEIERRVAEILSSCRPRPEEDPAGMFFRFWGDNAFIQAALDAQSTFGVDVDTASYTLARRYLAEGNLPQKAQIRTEEFVNYFKPDVEAPTEGVFSVKTEIAPSRFGGPEEKWMLRVTVRGKDVAKEERKPLNLTFVVDVSGSMNTNNRLETVKHGLRLLTAQLDGNDSVALVAYSTEARIVLPMTSAANRALIEEAIHGLETGGGTNAESGLKMGYQAAAADISAGRHHRVVMLSDGVANIGQTDQDRINADVKEQRDLGIYLNTIGVGMDNHNDNFLEQLANKGDGICNYIDNDREARRALVENFTGAFEPIARDVKIQVEFDSNVVRRYRQIGYENRAIADADFRNDAVDAGEVGAGHQVTALYELELEPNAKLVKGALAQVRLRWKEPTGADRDPAEDAATERQWATTLNSAVSWEGASYGFRRATCVAQFAELLRRSQHAREDSLDELIAEAERLEREHLAGQPGADDDFIEFIAMMKRSRQVILTALAAKRAPLDDCINDLRERRYRHHNCIVLEKGPEAAELEVEIASLEKRLHQLVEEEAR
jgi:Mg-chelatase subunit ChlD